MGYVLLEEEKKVIFHKGFYIGFKEKELGSLIGLSYALKLCLEMNISKLVIKGKILNVKNLFNDYYDRADPFKEKIA